MADSILRPVRGRVTLQLTALAAAVSALIGGCDCEQPPIVATPESQFESKGVRIEHRKGGEIAWHGTAERARGDAWNTLAEGVQMWRTPTEPDQPEIEIQSSTAQLQFESGRATFTEVRVLDGRGGTLRAGNAEYVEETQMIHATGPVHYESPGMVANGKDATLYLDDGRVEVTGPIEGTFEPQAAP